MSCTYRPLWHAGRAGAKGHDALNLTGRGIQPSRSTSQTPADGTLPLKQKKNIFFWEFKNSSLSYYITNKNKILNYNAVQSGKWVSTFPSCMPSSYSGPNETACSSATKLHGVTTSESILTAVKKLKSQTIKFLKPFLSLRSGLEKSTRRTVEHFARYQTHKIGPKVWCLND